MPRKPPRPDHVYQFVVMCLDRNTGHVRWQHVATEEVPHEGHHRDHGYASFSPTTDGKHLYVSFGSRGFIAMTWPGSNCGGATWARWKRTPPSARGHRR